MNVQSTNKMWFEFIIRLTSTFHEARAYKLLVERRTRRSSLISRYGIKESERNRKRGRERERGISRRRKRVQRRRGLKLLHIFSWLIVAVVRVVLTKFCSEKTIVTVLWARYKHGRQAIRAFLIQGFASFTFSARYDLVMKTRWP